MIGGILLTAGMAAGYAGVIEPHAIRFENTTRTLGALPKGWEGVRIAFLADIHADKGWGRSNVRKLLRWIGQTKPDIVLLGGDMANEDCEAARLFLRCVAAPLGVFSVLGNHEYYVDPEYMPRVLESCPNVRLLRNASVCLERNGDRLWIAGTDDIINGGCDIEKALSGIPDADCVLLLCHNPDGVIGEKRADLTLCGHVHGGQVSFFGLWGPLDYRQEKGCLLAGWRPHARGWQLTSRGIGTSILPLRFCARPEAHLITLRAK